MTHRSLLALLLLAFLAIPCLAEETASARFTSYLSTLKTAKSFAEVKPYFSSTAWSQTYAEYAKAGASEQAAIMAETAKGFQGWKVKKEIVKEGKTILTVGADKGEDSDVLMIKQNGVWLIDG